MSTAAIIALRHRAHTGLAAAMLLPGWKAQEQHQFWQGYAKALRDLERGWGAKLASKDGALPYEAPPLLQSALRELGSDIEHLTRREVLHRLAQAGIQLPSDSVADGHFTTSEFENGAIAVVDLHHKQAAPHVEVADGSGAHGRSVGGQGGVA